MADNASFYSQQGNYSAAQRQGEAGRFMNVEAADRVIVHTDQVILVKPPKGKSRGTSIGTKIRNKWPWTRRRKSASGSVREAAAQPPSPRQPAASRRPRSQHHAAPGPAPTQEESVPKKCRRKCVFMRYSKVCDKATSAEDAEGAWSATYPPGAAYAPYSPGTAAEDPENDDRWEAPPSPWDPRSDPRFDPRSDPRFDPRSDPRFDPRSSARFDPRLDPRPSYNILPPPQHYPMYYAESEEPQVYVQECQTLPAYRSYLVVPLGRAGTSDRAALENMAREAASAVPPALRVADRPEAVVVECRPSGEADTLYIDQLR